MLLLKALYRCMESTILWYDNELKEMDFKVNLYNKRVVNNMVNGSQCTLYWYIKKYEFSHVEYKVNKEIVEAFFWLLK